MGNPEDMMHFVIYDIYKAQGPRTHIALHVSPTRLEIVTALEAEGEGGIEGASVHEGFDGLLLQNPQVFTASIEELWTHKQWKDASVWCLHFGPGIQPRLYNFIAESFPTRRTFQNTTHLFGLSSTIALFVPYAEADFSDMHFTVFLPDKDARLVANIPFEEKSREYMETRFQLFLPTLTVSGPDTLAPDAQGEYTLRAFLNGEVCDQPLDVELEHVNGYLPKNRVRVLGGEATFRASALGLLPGDVLKLKAGFRYWAAVAEKKIEVIHG